MAYDWQTVEAASVTLGVSARTLARRISEGKIESRLENGRREVFVCLPDPEIPDEPEVQDSPAAEVLYSSTNDPADDSATNEETGLDSAPAVSIADHQVSSALALAESRIHGAENRARSAELTIAAFRQSTELAYHESRRVKLGARWAWGAVGAMAAAVIVATAWTTAKITRTQAQSEYLQQRIVTATTETDKALAAQADLRRQMEEARIGAARAQGQLQAMTQAQAQAQVQAQARQDAIGDARPAGGKTLLDRLASIIDGRDH